MGCASHAHRLSLAGPLSGYAGGMRKVRADREREDGEASAARSSGSIAYDHSNDPCAQERPLRRTRIDLLDTTSYLQALRAMQQTQYTISVQRSNMIINGCP